MVYVLELEHGKWYVGYTNSKSRRIHDHFAGYGSKWTKMHRPIRVAEWIRGGRLIEKKKALEYMKKFGVENVRGHQWCQVAAEFKGPAILRSGEAGDAKRSGAAGLGASAEQPLKLVEGPSREIGQGLDRFGEHIDKPVGWGESEHLHWSQRK